jgi:hypothetical protein
MRFSAEVLFLPSFSNFDTNVASMQSIHFVAEEAYFIALPKTK